MRSNRELVYARHIRVADKYLSRLVYATRSPPLPRARALHVFVHFHVRTFFFLISGPRARRSRAPAIGSRSGARPGRARNPPARLKIN